MSEFWPSYSEAGIKAFITSRIDAPEPIRPLNTNGVQAAKAKIQGFLNTIRPLSAEEYPCKEAYEAFEAERLATLDMVLDAGSASHVAALNDRIYGPLEDMHYEAALGHLAHYLDNFTPRSPDVASSRDLLLAAWKDVRRGGGVGRHFETIERYRLGLRPYVERRFAFAEDLLAGHHTEANLPSETVRDILIKSIGKILGERAGQWTALVQVGAPNVFIDYERHAIVVPAGRRYAADHINTLVVHEIGVHVQRSVNGSRSLERLAAFGLAGYGPAEEAFGVLLGNATKTKYQQINSLIPFAVINFVENSQTFRQVHDLTLALITCLANPSPEVYEKNHRQYARAAFSRVNRVLRLGNTSFIERSTTKYWRGLLLLSHYFDTQGLSQESFDRFFLGKYDCLSPQQLSLIERHTR